MNSGRSVRLQGMSNSVEAPWARIALVVGDLELPVGSIDQSRRCDLELVDDVLRFQTAAGRLGLRIRITDVHGDLRDLFDLLGVPP